jgi:hypothetical protein
VNVLVGCHALIYIDEELAGETMEPCGCQSWFDQFVSSSAYALGRFDQRFEGIQCIQNVR